MTTKFLKTLMGSAAALALGAVAAAAGPLMDRIEAGKPVRIGFANEVPWAYPGEDKEPLGFVNAYVTGVLHEMGHDRIEPVVTEWGGLIPGLKAGRFDIITGGMYILKERCENVAFSEPMAKVNDALIVAPGNPKGLHNMEDIAATGAIVVTGAGYNAIKVAKAAGVPDDHIMEVPGPTEILAAVKAGRADAGAVTYFTAQNLVNEAGGAVDISDVTKQPEDGANWVGIGFREEDADFLAAFNAAQTEYLGSEAMMEAVAPYGYGEGALPDDRTTEWVCANR
ncbi:ectoine/hydroxyectoine ABC transporter substrate-binding protein EhuB [Phaeovulum vinaykumarii]|uniref:Amino acid ABC transporter substrate-binding protein, PAAT family n=1 Tax=Phaeovulum vinaykumarii TaxID=407234 RepID=A0A1N7JUI5_9RHOB|nr:ectoine/hydroxyectoine ABC transporter substrate-binding protein EhuB [Phaeovulum vinaykumarii]SIS52997.1 amino acid ABC transporter substrate-binding protein, PAAT family [Phaeovulum vinaykumarii]SOB91461.1 amino acid ABC transporter substrate-binding protein (PAAT family) [Phaeovulum vinaykumarii]